MNEICVIHLVRAANGLTPFNLFIESYKDHPAGVDHDLILLFKGFRNDEMDQYHAVAHGIKYISQQVSDVGFDLNAYFTAIQSFQYKYYCFINSYSVVLERDWLLKLYQVAKQEGVGLVGATGSYESMYSNNVPARLFSKISRRHSLWKESILELHRWVHEFRNSLKLRYRFDKYPNYHIRTNAFLVSRDVWKRIKQPKIVTKMDAHRFESGKKSLTKQVMKMGLKALIVGRNGQAYDKEDWWQSNTFRKGDQSNLLIADNQTNHYQLGDIQTKKMLEKLAWGNGLATQHKTNESN